MTAAVIEEDEAPPAVLGNLIRLARIAKGLSQTELGVLVDARQSTVSSWESGKVHPTLFQLVDIARVLEVDGHALWDAADAERLQLAS